VTVRLASSRGLTFGEFSVLSALRRAGPPPCRTPTALLNELLITPSRDHKNKSITLHLSVSLSAIPIPVIRRGILVYLTPQGLEVIDSLRADLNNTDRVLIIQLTQEERELLTRITP